MKKGTLTEKQLNKMYKAAAVFDIKPPVIASWKTPFLWILWFFIGYSTESENIRMYWLDFRDVKYLLKSKNI